MPIKVHAQAYGPIADNRIQSMINAGMTSGEAKAAKATLAVLRGEFALHFRAPTGFYESQVQVTPMNSGFKVSDNGVIYGPWLEGTGTRNFPVTRFKGYTIFRRVAQLMGPEATAIISKEIGIRISG